MNLERPKAFLENASFRARLVRIVPGGRFILILRSAYAIVRRRYALFELCLLDLENENKPIWSSDLLGVANYLGPFDETSTFEFELHTDLSMTVAFAMVDSMAFEQ